MANRLQPVNLLDFVGGLNLRADAFTLNDTESNDLLNVEIVGDGGFRNRQGWSATFTAVANGHDWNPRHAYNFVRSNAPSTSVFTNANKVWWGRETIGSFQPLETAEDTAVVASAVSHEADFASWGDTLYIACGGVAENPSVKWDGEGYAVALTAPGIDSNPWQDDYTNPTVGNFPNAEHLETHAGYMFAASIREGAGGGTLYKNRIRWSHPNNPESWAEDDYIDLNVGGGKITGLKSFQDHLLIFKEDAVHALYGYDADSWQRLQVSRAAGASGPQAITRSPTAVYFAGRAGVFAYAGEQAVEISDKIRPAVENLASYENVWVGWSDRRLWVSVPDKNSDSTDAVYSYVFDPTIGTGAWSRYQSANGYAVGPFFECSCEFAALRGPLNVIVKLNKIEFGGDKLGSTAELTPFTAYYTTKWVDAGWPTLRKSWRRPDFVLPRLDADYQIGVQVYRNYDTQNPRRSFIVNSPGGSGDLWGEFDWGDGFWGGGGEGSTIQRASNLGLAAAVMMKISGPVNARWGVDGIVLKFLPRRFR
jgi:hypothetical protein